MERIQLHRLPYGRGLAGFFRLILFLAGIFCPAPALLAAETIQNEDCLGCHDSVDSQKFLDSVHGKNLCTSCHNNIQEIPHDNSFTIADPASPVYRFNIPTTCGNCHPKELEGYRRGIHNKAVLARKREAPVCTDCHGEHAIKSHLDPSSLVYTTAVSEKTCGHCHAAERIVSKYRLTGDRLKTYLESYHGLAGKYGITTVANCASCHGAHGILPSSDPDSSVHKKNLPQTCGRCHPNVGMQLAKGSVHIAPSWIRDRAVYFVSLFYMVLIILVIGGMLVHNALDYFKKIREHYKRKQESSGAFRFTRSERIQHLVLFLSFTVLAYTGFALKYSEAWWALPFTRWSTHVDWRGGLHRFAAVVFCGLSFYHAIFLLFTQRGRDQLRVLLPKVKDAADLIQMIRYNLGISTSKPKLETYSYIEKSEYWALLWGSMIMIATGVLLTFENIAMKFLPKWALDVAVTIHFYEAVLATLAIAVWHFYFTIFDPEQYPMNWSMMTGKGDEKNNDKDDSKDKTAGR